MTSDRGRPRLELVAGPIVAGGDALARDTDGRVVFVTGALPGERVVAAVVDEKSDFRRAAVVDVLDPSRDRTAPPCRNVALGCGGCGWQHITLGRQRSLKEDIVRDALRRIAGVGDGAMPSITSVALDDHAFRTTVQVAVRNGRAHFHRARSVELVEARGCWVAHPLVAALLDEGDFGTATAAVVRAAVASGERAVLLRPTRGAATADLPRDVDVATTAAPGRGVVHEEIRGRRLRVSIGSFFQASPAAAGALVDAVFAAAGPLSPGNRVADLYAGVGLFAGAVGAATGASVVAVERSRSAAGDARANLADLDGRVLRREVAAWRPEGAFDVVIADPARPGLGRPGADTVAACRPARAVLVSCDAASLARDVRLLGERGFALSAVAVIDAFAHTPHVEVVSTFLPV